MIFQVRRSLLCRTSLRTTKAESSPSSLPVASHWHGCQWTFAHSSTVESQMAGLITCPLTSTRCQQYERCERTANGWSADAQLLRRTCFSACSSVCDCICTSNLVGCFRFIVPSCPIGCRPDVRSVPAVSVAFGSVSQPPNSARLYALSEVLPLCIIFRTQLPLFLCFAPCAACVAPPIQWFPPLGCLVVLHADNNWHFDDSSFLCRPSIAPLLLQTFRALRSDPL